MSYTALARKWRPKNFSELVGQEHVLRALTNALDSGRVHHAFLFTGTRGVGKTTIARILAKCLNCERGMSSRPCGVCDSCREIDEGRFVDLLEVDAASRTKIDDTREMLDNVPYAPARGRYKVYLIDEVHMLSNHSFNALLKTLEEPPPHIKFLLATTDPQKLPVTVLSRCLQFNLKRLPSALIAGRIRQILEAEGIAFEPAAVQLLAHAADGSLRDGLSLLDQLLAFGGDKVSDADARSMLGTVDRERVLRLLRALAALDPAQLLAEAVALDEFSPDHGQVLDDMASVLGRVALRQAVPNYESDELYPHEWIVELAGRMDAADVQLYYQTAITARRDLPLAPDPSLGFRVALLRMLAFRPAAAPVGAGAAAAGGVTMASAAATPVLTAPGAAPVPPVPPVPPVAASRSPVAAVLDLDTLTPARWVALLPEMSLGGAARQLAANCLPSGREGDLVRLTLSTANKHLKTRQQEDKIAQALSRLSGRSVRIEIDIGELPEPSAAQRAEQQAAVRLAETERALQEDPNVQSLQKIFGAVVQSGSIRVSNEEKP
jgi:DNA polymerase-3 subunit gamma/tau